MSDFGIELTGKQIALLKVIIEGNRDEEGKFTPVDLDQIIERIFYHPTKQALQFSIRKLIRKGMIVKSGLEKRRDRQRVLISPTEEAISLFSAKIKDSYVSSGLELEEI